MTKCPRAHRVITHNKIRDVVAAIYRALHVHVTVEVQGHELQSRCRACMRNSPYGEHKAADVLVPASATGTDKATALDITITDPTNKTALEGVTGSLLWQQLFGTRSSWGHTSKHSRRQGTKVSPSRRDP